MLEININQYLLPNEVHCSTTDQHFKYSEWYSNKKGRILPTIVFETFDIITDMMKSWCISCVFPDEMNNF